MISSLSAEPANSVAAGLSWKTVKKGFRSTTRRPRKINPSLDLGLQHNGKVPKDETLVTESEKLGVVVLGNRFSEKVDQLPIKKRRHAQQPLPTTCPIPFDECSGISEPKAGPLNGFESKQRSWRSKDSIVDTTHPCSVDSYGIDLLATTACNTSIDDEALDLEEVKVEKRDQALPQIDASINTISEDASIICSQQENSVLKGLKSEDHDDSGERYNSSAVLGYIHGKSDTNAGTGFSSEKDVRLHWDLNKVVDEWELPLDITNTNSPKNDSFHVGSEGLCNQETEKVKSSDRPLDPGHAWELLKCPSKVESSAHVVKESKFPDSGSDIILSQCLFKEKMNLPVENHGLISTLQLGQTLATENVDVGKQDIVVDPTISEKSLCDVVRIKFNEDYLSELPDSGNIVKLMGTTLGAEDPSSKSGKTGLFSEKGINLEEKREMNVPLVDGPSEGSSEFEVKHELRSCERFGKVALKYPLDDGYVSDYSPSGHHHLVRMSKYQSGYESPVEDGELRESVAHSWQENEHEVDSVDYDTDDIDGVNEKFPGKVLSGKNDSSKESSHSVTTGNSFRRDRIPERCERVANTVEQNNAKLRDVGAFNSNRKFSLRRLSEGKVESRVTKNLSTHLQGSSILGGFDGIDNRYVQRRSGAYFPDGQDYRSEKYFGRDRPVPRLLDESQKKNHDGGVSGNWDSRNHYQNGYRRGGGNSRLRNNTIPDDKLVYDDQRHSRGSYQKGEYRPIDRRPHDDTRRNFPARVDSNYSCRGRSVFYKRGFHDLDESATSWVPNSHSARRQCSTSPVHNKNTSFYRPGIKSRSRSRTKSPVPWHLRWERNVRERRIRSPDLRPEGRIGRNRIHYDDSKFSQNEDGLGSPARRRIFNDRNNGPTHFRGRNSPGRFFGQRERFDSNGTGGRMKTDDGSFRPRINSERFSEQSGGGWRERHTSNYDGSDSERTRYNNNKHEMIRRVRHSETGGVTRRFRSDADSCFEDHYAVDEFNNNNHTNRNNSSCIRSTEKSEALGGRVHHRNYDGDRTRTTSAKLTGVRNGEDDVSVSRG